MKKLLAAFLFSLSALSACFGQTGNQFALQVQNSGTPVYTAYSYAVLNLTNGCTGSVVSGVLNITCTGTGGGVTSLSGDGTILSNSASTGAVTLTLANTVTGTGGVVLATSPVVTGLSSNTLTSTVATGTAPLTVASTTNVANLNAATLNGATFASPGSIGTGTAGSATFSGLTANTTVTGKTGITAGVVGTTAGVLNLSGSTSGTATFTAPAVAGTTSNAVVSSNAISAPSYAATGATSGFFQLGQGSTNAAGTTNITEQAPTAVTSYLVTKPGTAASGLAAGTNASGTITQNFTGSTAFTPAAITIGSGTSIAATSLCSTTNCPAGNYQVNVYVEVTTACTTTGSYNVWLGYTDDAGAKTGSATTTSFALTGNGTTPITSAAGASLVPTSTTDYATGQYFIHTTGAATSALGSINYGTTAGACGTGGPMVGKMFLTVVPLS